MVPPSQYAIDSASLNKSLCTLLISITVQPLLAIPHLLWTKIVVLSADENILVCFDNLRQALFRTPSYVANIFFFTLNEGFLKVRFFCRFRKERANFLKVSIDTIGRLLH